MNNKTLLLLVAISALPILAGECPSSCAEIIQERAAALTRLQRLGALKESNHRYIASLSPGDFSKRMKVESNILILDRRVKEAREIFQPLDEKYQSKQCAQCEGN